MPFASGGGVAIIRLVVTLGPVVITGANGYIGKALTRRLAAAGRQLRLVSRTTNPASGCSNVERIASDIRTPDFWDNVLGDAAAVIHLSARTDLHAAEDNPAEDERINVEPVRRLIEAAARRRRPLDVVFSSTVTIVGDHHNNPVDEQVPANPISTYDRHKLICENLFEDANKRGWIRSCSLRLANVYGGGSTSVNTNRGILNLMISRAAKGEALTIFGSGQYIRDFVYLDDVVNAFERALVVEAVRNGGYYVIATGKGHSVRDALKLVAELAEKRIGHRIELRYLPEPSDLHPIERRNFVGNSALFRGMTGWKPQIDIRAGIAATLDSLIQDAQ